MHCSADVCYVCLEKKKEIGNINNPVSVNKDIFYMIGYLPCNLSWLRTKKIILVCEVCCLRFRETYQFLQMCHKNSAILKSDMDLLNSTPISNIDNGAELSGTLDLNVQQQHANEVKCEIKLEGDEIYRDEYEPVIEETEDVYVNLEDSFVKEENTWKREEADERNENPIDNNSTEITDKESDSVGSNAHITHTDHVTHEQVNVINKEKLNLLVKKYGGVNTGEEPYTCSSCKKCFNKLVDLESHVRMHVGKKSFTCSVCNKYFRNQWHLVSHMRTHTGEKPYTCSICNKCFSEKSGAVRHMRIHTGEKPHACSECKRCFSRKADLMRHIRLLHSGGLKYVHM